MIRLPQMRASVKILPVAGLVSALALSLLGGCSAVPNVGPKASDVAEEATAPDSERRYAVVQLDDRSIQMLRGRSGDSSFASFGDHRGSVDPRVGVGDVVSLTIWEAGSGGLFSGAVADRLSAGSRSAAIPEQTVGRDGYISVPYAGRVRAAGRTTQDIQHEIERALEGKAIQPQALVTVSKPMSNMVTVLGEAAGGGARVPVSPKGDRVLDVIASAGGVRAPMIESFVQLSRGSRTVRVAMTRVAADPRENIFVRPGDVLTVIRDPQRFYAYGATGRNAEIPFEAEGVTLAQALSKAGGLLDYRADPQGVFVFRLEPESFARRLPEAQGVASSAGRVKVVYQINMRDPNSMFLANQFRVFNRDLIYVSNAPMTDAQKFLQLFNMVVAPVSSGASIANAVQ